MLFDVKTWSIEIAPGRRVDMRVRRCHVCRGEPSGRGFGRPVCARCNGLGRLCEGRAVKVPEGGLEPPHPRTRWKCADAIRRAYDKVERLAKMIERDQWSPDPDVRRRVAMLDGIRRSAHNYASMSRRRYERLVGENFSISAEAIYHDVEIDSALAGADDEAEATTVQIGLNFRF